MRPRYLTPQEVSLHNVPEDAWVSFLGAVYDLTPLCDQYKGDLLLKPIIEAAGQDISHWFDLKTKDIRTHVDPVTNTVTFHTPQGRFLHVPPPYPSTDWANDFGRPWWRDTSYQVGLLSKKTRFIRVINTLTSQEHIIEPSTAHVARCARRRSCPRSCTATSSITRTRAATRGSTPSASSTWG
uniref:Cytochrome b5 domain-containing protein 1 n=1 Tax=Petromyzon marinus TaxID=7757 RepID=A0AAJ7TKG3_PETMA|nr:cytochrome b5 domain-containing protein 1 isoform X3 [Petromyzon marinus]